MLDFNDIPSDYHGHRVEPGPRYHRFAIGVPTKLKNALGTPGIEAGHRLVQSAWHLRYSGIGVGMFDAAPSLSDFLEEDDQFVYLSGFQLAVTSAAASIDLAAGTLTYLAGGQRREPDLRDIASNRRQLLDSLPPSHQAWVTTTNAMSNVDRLMDVRNALVHRLVPTSVIVRPGGLPSYTVEVDGKDEAVDPVAMHEIAVDRFVSLGLLLEAEFGPPERTP